MASCPCNIAGALSVNYQGITSATLNGGTDVALASDGTILIGETTSTLSISAWAFLPGQDPFLGATCPASASASIRWIKKYDCLTETTYMIPQSGGKASIVGGPINGVYLSCDPNIVSKSFTASVQNGPVTPYIDEVRHDGFNLIYSGNPISIQSALPDPYTIQLGTISVMAYLQSFSLSVSPPSPATVNYSFVCLGAIT
jgi:hypothetical protein